jgi:uncharacterized protein YukE
VDSKKGLIGELLQVLLDFVKKELSDGAPDAIISSLLQKIFGDTLKQMAGKEIDIESLLYMVEQKYMSIPDVDVGSLNTGSKKLAEVMGAVQSGEIKVTYESFVLTYNLLRQKADEMENEYNKIKNALNYLTEDWIGEDQKAFVKVGKKLQKELKNQIKEVRDMADKVEMSGDAFKGEEDDWSRYFSEEARTYRENFNKAQNAITTMGG